MKKRKSDKFRPTKVDKIGIVVKDIDKVIESWSQIFDLGEWDIVDVDHSARFGRPYKIKLAFVTIGSLQIELIQRVEGEVFQAEYLDKYGEGIHDIGFKVDDVDAEASKFEDKEVEIPYRIPGRLAFIKTGEPGDVIFELFTEA
jgi:hypothetical protein